jgi:hypothetical protein
MLSCSLPLPIKPSNTEVASSCGYLSYTHCAHCQCRLARCCASTSLLAMCGSVPINWACCQGMFVLVVKAARITNISFVKFLDGGGSKVVLGRRRGHCQWVWTIPRSDYSTGDKNCTRPLSCISKWIGATSTMTCTTLSAAPIAVPTAALTEIATIE